MHALRMQARDRARRHVALVRMAAESITTEEVRTSARAVLAVVEIHAVVAGRRHLEDVLLDRMLQG